MNRTFQQIIDGYYESAKNKCNAHFRLAERHKARQQRLGIAATGTSALVGTSVISAALQTPPQTWLQVTAAGLSVAAVVLTSLQAFLDYPSRISEHKIAAAGYEAVKRALDFVSMKFPDATGRDGEPGTAELEQIRATLDDLVKQSPSIPDADYDAVVRRKAGGR